MQPIHLNQKDTLAYIILTSIVICGLAVANVTAAKVIEIGIVFPFANIVFAIFSYPIVDCICELWGKRVARQTVYIALACQILIALLIHLSILAPAASFWSSQTAYASTLSASSLVVFASAVSFTTSQLFDVFVYQRIKDWSHGKHLWLRSNMSTYLGQMIDSAIFVMIVFYNSSHKLTILAGAITVKIIISFLMTPVVYAIVYYVDRLLDRQTLAFKPKHRNTVRLSPGASTHVVSFSGDGQRKYFK